MQLRDATSVFGRVVILIPLILVFLTFADSAFACPGHTNGAAYRTRVKTKSWSNMPTTVISYRAPATYKRCGNNLYDTRGARYVSNGHRSGAKYVAVRNGGGNYRMANTRYVAVRNADYYDEPSYVAVRRQPVYVERDVRYVAVRRSEPRVRYVRVRDADDDNDVRYIAVRRSIPRTKYVAVRDVDFDDDDDVRYVTMRSCAEPVSTKTIAYQPVAYDDDIDHLAFLDGGGATYVADDEIENACLSSRYVDASPGAVSYVPIDDEDDYAFHGGSAVSYIETDYAVPMTRHVVMVDDDLADAETTYIAADDINAETVSYVPVDDVEEIEAETVAYAPAHDRHAAAVSYVPVDDVDTTYVDADACPIAVSSVDAEPVYVADDSAVLVEDSDVELVGTEGIAGKFGYRDGLEDGKDAALEGDEYYPENSGDFRKATEGYEGDYGDKDVYKDVYRSTYLDGYQAGFESAASIV